jgi:hypothetical protein
MYREKLQKPDHSKQIELINSIVSQLEEPLKLQSIVSSYSKILLDEIMHLKELDAKLSKASQAISSSRSALQGLASELDVE